MKPYFHYISLETRPQKLEFGRNMDSFVRYFCQEKDYRSLISGEVGLVPKIVRYWSFVIDQYCVYTMDDFFFALLQLKGQGSWITGITSSRTYYTYYVVFSSFTSKYSLTQVGIESKRYCVITH